MVFRIAGKIVQSTTTVTTTATAIPATSAVGRKALMIINNGSNTVYLGASSVTTSNGYPLNAGDEKAFDIDELVVLYGITGTGTSDVRSLEGV